MNIYRTIFVSILSIISFLGYTQPPKRIVSLAPSLTKNIYYLEAQSQLIGCTNFCTEALAENKEVVASAISVNIEKTISLLPDLVLVTRMTSPETIEKLRDFDIKVEVFPTPISFKEICDQFQRIGELTGRSQKAVEIIEASKKKIEALKLNSNTGANVFFQIGADPIFTVLPKTFMNDFITMPGGKNISENLTKGTMTRESVLAYNPDYIFIVTMGIVGENEKDNWLQFEDLSAAKNNHIFIIDAEKACSPTPITFVETIETVVKLMNQ